MRGCAVTTDVKEKLKSLSIDRTAFAQRKTGGKMWALAGCAVAGIAAVAFLVIAPQGRQAAAATVASPTTVASPAAQNTGSGTIASGYVVARRSATLSADISGKLVVVSFEEGALVTEGQVLAELDDGLARYDLDLAQARLQSARATVQAVEADLIEGEAQLRRAELLSKTSTISPAALAAAQTKIQSLTARYDAARADARVAELAVERQADFVERHKIRAPFAGVIIAKKAQRGEILSASPVGGEAKGVATLVDMTSLEVEVDVSENQISKISAGQKASVVLDAYPGLVIPAKVLAVIPTADRDRATIQVRVGFTEIDPRIVPQMAAKVTFADAEG
jgi:HlyD family secretion protein